VAPLVDPALPVDQQHGFQRRPEAGPNELERKGEAFRSKRDKG
jgi:hypothetical protein